MENLRPLESVDAKRNQILLRSVFYGAPGNIVASEKLHRALELDVAEGVDWHATLDASVLKRIMIERARATIPQAPTTPFAHDWLFGLVIKAYVEGIDRNNPSSYEVFRLMRVTEDTWHEEGMYAPDPQFRKPIERATYPWLLAVAKRARLSLAQLEEWDIEEGHEDRIKLAEEFIVESDRNVAKFLEGYGNRYGEVFPLP